MDIWGILALLFAGAFFAILVIALFYWRTVRPQLLATTLLPPQTAAPAAPQDGRLLAAIQALNETLVRHSALLSHLPTSFEVRAPVGGESLAHTLEAIHRVQAEQSGALARLEREVAALGTSEEPVSEALMRVEVELATLRETREAQDRLRQHLEAQRAILDDLKALLAALNEGNLYISTMLAAQRDLLAQTGASQERNAQALETLRQRLDQLLSGEQDQTRMLQELTQQGPPVQTIIREEVLVPQDRLQDIKGIGPVYSGMLHERGIHTFEQLGALMPEDLYILLDVPEWRIDAESWIEQAQLLAAQRRKREGKP